MTRGPATTLLALLLCTAEARAEPRIQKGARELSVHVTPDFESAIGDQIDLRVGYGLFVRDRLSARATFAYELLEDVAGEDSDYRTWEIGLDAARYLGGSRRLVPYLGAGVGWRRTRFGTLDESGAVAGPLVGLKLFLADNVALALELRYRLGSADVFVNDFVPEDDDLSSSVGLTVHF